MDKSKISIYVPAAMLADIRLEADRIDRTVSWMLQQSWKFAQQQRMFAKYNTRLP